MAVELKEGDVSTEVVPTVQVSIAVVPVGYIFAEAVVFRAIVYFVIIMPKHLLLRLFQQLSFIKNWYQG